MAYNLILTAYSNISKELIKSLLPTTKQLSDITGVQFNKTNATTIDDYTFDECTNLSTVINIQSCVDIGKYAFYGCPLTSNIQITLANDFTNIGEYAFANTKTSKVYLITNNKHDINIGKNAFENCFNLTSIYFETNTEGNIILGAESFKNCSQIFANNVFYSNRINVINNNAFEGTPLWNKSPSELKLSSIMKKIIVAGTEENPITIKYYNPNTYIDPDQVLDFSKIQGKTLEMKDVNDAFAEKFSDNDYPRQTECDVVIGNQITAIADNAFIGCKGIKTVDASNVRTFGKSVFKDCTKLSSVVFNPINTNCIGVDAFNGCTSLKTMKNSNKVLSVLDGAFEFCSDLTDANLSSATYIGVNAFKMCNALSSIDVGNAVKIGDGAFNTNIEGKYTINLSK